MEAAATRIRSPLQLLRSLAEHSDYPGLREDPDFFGPAPSGIHSPLLLPDMETAIDILGKAVAARESILVIGDRDVDGVSSTALIGYFLEEFHERQGGKLELIVSDSGDDYGLSGDVLKRALESKANLVILLDMGSSNGPEIQQLKDAGSTVIVLDHHQLHDRVPDTGSCALVNPMRLPDEERQEHAGKIATVGLAFKLLLGYAISHTREWQRVYCLPDGSTWLAYRVGFYLGTYPDVERVSSTYPDYECVTYDEDDPLYRLDAEERDRITSDPVDGGKIVLAHIVRARPRLLDFMSRLADLAALGITTDLVPLVGENRAIVRLGLGLSWRGEREFRCGYQALLRALRLPSDRIRSRELGWNIGPVINAAGRMGDTRLALSLLLCREPSEADRLAKALVKLNEDRKKRVKRNEVVVREHLEKRPHLKEEPIVFCYHPDLEPGVSGIVASRLSEQYLRPVVYVNPDGDYARGSARTFGGRNVLHLLDSASDLFIQFGGHPEAAGFSIEYDRIPKLEKRLLSAARRWDARSGDEQSESEAWHLELRPGQLSGSLREELDLMEPFGPGNPEPVFLIRNAEVYAVKTMTEGKHARFRVRGVPSSIDFIAWRLGPEVTGCSGRLDVLGCLERDFFRGSNRLQFRVDRVLPASE